MTLSSPLNTQQLELENIINYVSPSQQNQNQEITGQKCTRCEVTQPLNEFSINSYGEHKFHRKICKTCRDTQQESKLDAIEDKWGYRDTSLIKENRPPEGTKCQCCSTSMTYGLGMDGMCFDHDPIKGKFRGWICKKCNTSLGLNGDNEQGIMDYVKYLTLYEITN